MTVIGRVSARPAHVTLIVVSYNNRDQLRNCLDAVAAGQMLPTQIVIVENGDEQSATEGREIIVASSALSGQVIHCPSNPGYAAAINAGIAGAPDADAYWILNPDTVAGANALSAMVTSMGEGYDIVGGRIVDRSGVIQSDGGLWRPSSARAVSIDKGLTVDAALNPAVVRRRLGFVSGASFLVRRSILPRVGMLREDYFLYAEEVEWCVRAAARGARLGFAPDATVIHDQGSSTGYARSVRARPRLPIFLDERNKLNVVRDTRPALFPVAALFALVLLIMRYGKSRAWRQLGYGLHGWWHGVIGARNKPPWLSR